MLACQSFAQVLKREKAKQPFRWSLRNECFELRDTFGMKQEPRANQATEVESAIQDFIRKAAERGYEIDYEEAKQYIEPRMANEYSM